VRIAIPVHDTGRHGLAWHLYYCWRRDLIFSCERVALRFVTVDASCIGICVVALRGPQGDARRQRLGQCQSGLDCREVGAGHHAFVEALANKHRRELNQDLDRN
jgi:hypothetical protein